MRQTGDDMEARYPRCEVLELPCGLPHGSVERAQGCLLGQLAGDSSGSLVEFRTEASIRSRCPEGISQLEDGGTFNTLAGQLTDDSEMALMLARSILAKGRFGLPEQSREARSAGLSVHFRPSSKVVLTHPAR